MLSRPSYVLRFASASHGDSLLAESADLHACRHSSTIDEMSPNAPRVIAVITTYKRPVELRRLLSSLAASVNDGLAATVVIDNAEDRETAEVAARTWPFPVRYFPQQVNKGHGAGHAIGIRACLEDPNASHIWLIDDDAEALPDTLRYLLEDATAAKAGAAVPLLENSRGEIAWYPGPLSNKRWREIRRPKTTALTFRAACGGDVADWTWSPWCMLLMTRQAVEAIGVPRDDFGFMADDIEYSLRLSANFRTVLVPRAVGRHLPPAAKTGTHGFYTDSLNLQNMSFVTWRLAHGARARRHWPGHFRRFFATWGWTPHVLGTALRAAWRGAVRGRPGGAPGFDDFRQRWLAARSA
jgi:rhamnopyranosyl-N-acetylglucosaminyl-diphospho-decaprenol beta-1,3/1,4-galactofuranosyltransferase